SNGGAPGDACKLVTNDEAAAATGTANVTSGPIPLENMTDAVAGCAYVSGGTVPVLNVIYLKQDAMDTTAVKGLPGTVQINVGGGAQAYWVPGAGLVAFVYKNGKIVMIQVMMPLNNDVQATASGLAPKIADRM